MRLPSVSSSFAYALLACGIVSPAAAQQSDSVVLLAPPEVLADWTAALQLELAAQGTVAIPAEAPVVATPLLGDAAAQQMAIARGARAAVWVEATPDAWRLRMVSPTAERARVVPVARDADARTVALILVSLLEGPPTPTILVIEQPAAQISPADALRSPAITMPVVQRDDDEEPPIAPGGPYVRWSALTGLAGVAFANPARAEFGLAIRAGIALRYDGFEAAILHDLGLYFEQSSQSRAQPFGRACLEGGGGTSRTQAAFHAGARACFGSRFAFESAGSPISGGFTIDGPRTHVSGGGYAAVSFGLTGWLRLFLRADLELGWTDMFTSDWIDVVPTVSTYLSWE